MLIHQSDFIIINLEKVQDKYYHSYFKEEWNSAEKWEVVWDWFSLVFTIQINWKIKRSEHRFEVLSKENWIKLYWEKDEPNPISWYYIKDYSWIYATLNLLSDLWYNLKEWEFENYYKITSKIEEEIKYYYESINNVCESVKN